MDQHDQSRNGGQWAGQDAALIAGLLIAGGSVAALAMALKKVRNPALWAIPVGLFGAGIALSVQSMQQRQAKIEEIQEEIVSLFDQLDPVGRVQVAKYVAEAEFEKL